MRLRDSIAELRISKLANTVGADGFSRCPMLPFWTRTSRCQPSARDKVFLPSLPSWLHGLLRPPPGFALVELDWAGQEYAIAAALSGDAGMIADYQSGDPHWAFGVRAGLVPADADKAEYKEFRDKVLKPVTHGQNYGMTPYGIAAKTGRSLLWARDVHARHRSDLSGIPSLARRHRGTGEVRRCHGHAVRLADGGHCGNQEPHLDELHGASIRRGLHAHCQHRRRGGRHPCLLFGAR